MPTQTWNIGFILQLTLMTYPLVWFTMFEDVSGQDCFPGGDQPDMSGIDTVTDGSIDFAISLFKSVAEFSNQPGSGNCHISPVSVRIALITAYLGAMGNTKTEMQTALLLGNDNQGQVLQRYQKYKSSLMHDAIQESNYAINIGDRIYLDNGVNLRPCMVDHLKSELQQADLQSAPDESCKLINKWVEDETHNKIMDLLPDGSIGSDTTMVIVNAIYMSATWAKPFKSSHIFEGDFFLPETTKKVSMMHLVASVSHGNSQELGCEALQLPYSGHDLNMVFLLPNSNTQDVLNRLNAKDLRDLLSSMNLASVNLTMPKFEITQSVKLTDNLKALGINDLFDNGKADLSGFTETGKIFVQDFFHKTFIKVDEYGTEAAAASGLAMEDTAIVNPNVQFNVNRPFLFMIIKDHSVLFMGLINDPTAES